MAPFPGPHPPTLSREPPIGPRQAHTPGAPLPPAPHSGSLPFLVAAQYPPPPGSRTHHPCGSHVAPPPTAQPAQGPSRPAPRDACATPGVQQVKDAGREAGTLRECGPELCPADTRTEAVLREELSESTVKPEGRGDPSHPGRCQLHGRGAGGPGRVLRPEDRPKHLPPAKS